MSDDDAPAPVTNNYEETMREALNAQIDLAPDLYKAEANEDYGRKAYARLQQEIIRESMLGEELTYDDQGRLVAGFSGGEGGRYQVVSRSYEGQKVDGNGRPLFSDKYGRETVSATRWKVRGGTSRNPPIMEIKNEYTLVDSSNGKELGRFKTHQEAFDKGKELGAGDFKPIYKKDANGEVIVNKEMAGKTVRQGGAIDLIAGNQVTQFSDGTVRKAGFDESGNFLGASQLEQDILERAKYQQTESEIGLANQFGGELTEAYRDQGNVREALQQTESLAGVSALSEGFNLTPERLSDQTSRLADMYRPSVRYRNGQKIVEDNLIQSPDGVADVVADSVANAVNVGDISSLGVESQNITSGQLGDLGFRDRLKQIATDELDAGGDLTAQERRNVQQDARVASTARGRARDYGSVVDEVENLDFARRQRQAERRQFASQVLSQEADLTSRDIDSSFRADQINQQSNLQAQMANQSAGMQASLANQQAGITSGQSANQVALANQASNLQAGLSNQASALQTQANDLQVQTQNQALKDAYLARDISARQSDISAMMQAQQISEQMRMQGLGMDRAYASQRVGLEQATSADPFLAITGRTSGAAVGSGQAIYGNGQIGLSGGPALFNPAQGAEFMANQSAMINNYNAANYGAQQAKQGAIIGGALNAIGSIGGGFTKGLGMAAGGGCWVAREVYGQHNPMWLIFRHWMLFISPFWFRAIYLNFGERFAKFIKDKPKLKARIRAWMDTKIKEVI